MHYSLACSLSHHFKFLYLFLLFPQLPVEIHLTLVGCSYSPHRTRSGIVNTARYITWFSKSTFTPNHDPIGISQWRMTQISFWICRKRAPATLVLPNTGSWRTAQTSGNKPKKSGHTVGNGTTVPSMTSSASSSTLPQPAPAVERAVTNSIMSRIWSCRCRAVVGV